MNTEIFCLDFPTPWIFLGVRKIENAQWIEVVVPDRHPLLLLDHEDIRTIFGDEISCVLDDDEPVLIISGDSVEEIKNKALKFITRINEITPPSVEELLIGYTHFKEEIKTLK